MEKQTNWYITGGDGADLIARRVILPNSHSFLSQFFSIQMYTLNNRTEMQRCVDYEKAVRKKCAKSQSQMKRTTFVFKIGKRDSRGFSEFKAFIISSILLWKIVCQNPKPNPGLLVFNSCLRYLSSAKSLDAQGLEDFVRSSWLQLHTDTYLWFRKQNLEGIFANKFE